LQPSYDTRGRLSSATLVTTHETAQIANRVTNAFAIALRHQHEQFEPPTLIDDTSSTINVRCPKLPMEQDAYIYNKHGKDPARSTACDQ